MMNFQMIDRNIAQRGHSQHHLGLWFHLGTLKSQE